MSTKSTLYHNEEYHLYTEGFDHTNVYLDWKPGNSYYSEGREGITIPLSVWAAMRTHTVEPEETYLSYTTEEMLVEGAIHVAAHREWLRQHEGSTLAQFAGVVVFGPPESDDATMLHRWMLYFGRTPSG